MFTPDEVLRAASDFGEPETELLVHLGLEPPAVAIGGVEVVVVGPGDRPIVAAVGLADDRIGGRPLDRLDQFARRIRCAGPSASILDRHGDRRKERFDGRVMRSAVPTQRLTRPSRRRCPARIDVDLPLVTSAAGPGWAARACVWFAAAAGAGGCRPGPAGPRSSSPAPPGSPPIVAGTRPSDPSCHW
jgi:hypothetical protein